MPNYALQADFLNDIECSLLFFFSQNRGIGKSWVFYVRKNCQGLDFFSPFSTEYSTNLPHRFIGDEQDMTPLGQVVQQENVQEGLFVRRIGRG